jgi:hypothetical protein
MIQFISPIDGDMLHAGDGEIYEGRLSTVAKVAASPGARIQINGIEAVASGEYHTAAILLERYENTVEAVNIDTGEKAQIRVYLLKNLYGHYRLSIDDNIWFLRDIQQNSASYTSLFDNSYLGFLKGVNQQYGTKIHLNIFYETDGFNLSEMTDKFKDEWKANAGWLRLSFHAKGEFPDRPYIAAGYDQVKADCDQIVSEIKRFAGEEVMTSVTTIHWGEATVEGSRAMRDAGYRGQLGYFNVDDDRAPVSYYLSVEQRRHMKKRFIWMDTAEGIVFIRSSIVLDTTPLNDIVSSLDSYEQTLGKKPPYVDFLIHEQYYYPFYQAYQPEYREKILTAVQWATNNGYTPAFLCDFIFE